MNKTFRTIKHDEVAEILAGNEFIVVEPITPEVFIYGHNDDGFFEKEFIFLEDDVIEVLASWADSKIIAQREFEDKIAGYYYDCWCDKEDGDGLRPENAREQAFALGLV
jgi:hypothetical protein